MDELEKNKDLPDEAEATNAENADNAEKEAESGKAADNAEIEAENGEAAQSEAEPDELQKELESIRDMFQTELDKAAEDGSEEMLIQELDEIENEADDENDTDEIPEDELCACCGEKRRDASFGDDYPYCTDCRELMKHNPLNWFGIIAVVIMICVTALSYVLIADTTDDFITLLDANQAYSEGKLADASAFYNKHLQSKSSGDTVSMRAVKNMIVTLADLGYYADSNVLITKFFSEDALNRPWNKEYKDIADQYELLMNTSTVINETLGDALGGGDLDYDENMEELDKIIEENKTDRKYSEAFLEYGKYLLMYKNDDDKATQLEQLQKIEKIDEGKHPWIYLTYIMNLAAKTGDTELAEKYFKVGNEINVQEMSMYTYYAEAYRFCDKPDADKIMEIAKLAESNYSPNVTPDFYRSYAIAYLLKGDGENAMKSIESYMQNCQPTVNDVNLYALCAAYVNDSEAYDYAKGMLENSGYKLSSSVKKFKNKKLTIEQVLTEKGGDI